MKLPHIACLLLALTASCVLPGDIRSLRENMDDFQAGAVTKPEYDQRNAEIVAEMERRNDELRSEGGQIPTDPMSLLLYGGTILGTIMGSKKVVNDHRDKRRVERNEKV